MILKWEVLYHEAHSLYQKGHLDCAIAAARIALQKAEQTFTHNHTNIAKSLNILTELLIMTGNDDDLYQYCKRALAIYENIYGVEHIIITKNLKILAKLSDARTAATLYNRILEIKEKTYGSAHPSVVETLDDLADHYNRLMERDYRYGFGNELANALERALEINEKLYGDEHPTVALSLSKLAWHYFRYGRQLDSENLFKRALVIDEKLLGTEHPDIATLLSQLGMLYIEQKRYSEAELNLERALIIREVVFGPNNREVACSLEFLASFYISTDRKEIAVPFRQRAEEIYKINANTN